MSVQNEPEPPIGSVLHPTAVANGAGYGAFVLCNRDNLWGPGPGKPPAVWGIRQTLPGSNGYKHQPWISFLFSNGTACSTEQCDNNCVITWVRVESMEEAMKRGPDAYGPSR